MPEFSFKSKQKLKTCREDIQRVFIEVIKHFDCTILEGYRNKDTQNRYFNEGKSKAQYPMSKHNSEPSKAVDVVPYPIDWTDTNRMYYFAGFVKGVASQMGIKIRWGGDWDCDTQTADQKFNDLPHFEVY